MSNGICYRELPGPDFSVDDWESLGVNMICADVRNFGSRDETARALLKAVDEETGPRRPGRPTLLMILQENEHAYLIGPELEAIGRRGINWNVREENETTPALLARVFGRGKSQIIPHVPAPNPG